MSKVFKRKALPSGRANSVNSNYAGISIESIMAIFLAV